MAVLGVWDGHDAGAALVDASSGRIVCAVNEERFTRRKLEVAFPARAIAACLDEAGIGPKDVEEVAFTTNDVAKTLTRFVPAMKESYYRRRRRLLPPGPLDSARRAFKYTVTRWSGNRFTRRLSAFAVRRMLRPLGFENPRLAFVKHHMAHAASAAFTCPFDEALVVTLDGVGDGLSGTLSRLKGRSLTLERAIAARDSLGIFFELVTQLLNMRELEDEGKVMALASYDHYVEEGANSLVDLFEVEGTRIRARCGPLAMRRFLVRQLHMMPSERFAWMAQRSLETIVSQWVSNALRATGASRIAYAGGVASNIQVNRRLRELEGLESLFVFPHMGDGGLALGAALARTAASGLGPTRFPLGDARLGPKVSSRAMEEAVRASGLPFEKPASIAAETARRLADDQIVMWFQGRMEYGPRALGGRSILARPDSLPMKERLNAKLKRRVWYQPFCPSMLDAEGERLLVCGDPNRYMTLAYRTLPEARSKLAAVLAPDGTCRPQMVDPSQGVYHALLVEMKKRIGVGAVLNTSFNLHGEPIVATPSDALETFARSSADALVVGELLVTPRNGGSA